MEKPLFRDSAASRRCAVPSTGFWERDGEKQKYFFTLPGETALYMAGLYAVRDGTPRYCILTTEANASIKVSNAKDYAAFEPFSDSAAF